MQRVSHGTALAATQLCGDYDSQGQVRDGSLMRGGGDRRGEPGAGGGAVNCLALH